MWITALPQDCVVPEVKRHPCAFQYLTCLLLIFLLTVCSEALRDSPCDTLGGGLGVRLDGGVSTVMAAWLGVCRGKLGAGLLFHTLP